jgi:hypothetical protein
LFSALLPQGSPVLAAEVPVNLVFRDLGTMVSQGYISHCLVIAPDCPDYWVGARLLAGQIGHLLSSLSCAAFAPVKCEVLPGCTHRSEPRDLETCPRWLHRKGGLLWGEL